MNIHLHIERLVLDGVDTIPGQNHVLQSHVTTELTRMIRDGELSPNLTQAVAIPHIFTDDIQLPDNKSSAEMGQQIAQSVYGGIGHE